MPVLCRLLLPLKRVAHIKPEHLFYLLFQMIAIVCPCGYAAFLHFNPYLSSCTPLFTFSEFCV